MLRYFFGWDSGVLSFFHAGAVLGICLLDHLVIGTHHYYSMEEGQKSVFPEEEGWEVLDEDF